jgi:hypothetical protein
MNPALDWLRAFAFTLLVECPLALLYFRAAEPRRSRRLLGAVLATLATHPLVWFAFPHLPLTYLAMVELSELFAWLAEAGVYGLVFPGLRLPRALLGSALANGASFGLGLVLRALVGWP